MLKYYIFVLSSIYKALVIISDDCKELRVNFKPQIHHLSNIILQNLVKLCTGNVCPDEYYNIEKVIMSLELDIIKIIDLINKEYEDLILSLDDKYDLEIIQKILPNYYSFVIPELNRLIKESVNLKKIKNFSYDYVNDNFESSIKIHIKIYNLYLEIKQHICALRKIQSKNRKEKSKKIVVSIFVSFVIPLAALFVSILTLILNWSG